MILPKWPRALFVFSLSFALLPGYGQTQFSAWASNLAQARLGSHFIIQNDISFRSSDQVKHLQTLLIRPGLSYRINPLLRLSAGYSWVLARKSIGDRYVHEPEHAVWEQLWINKTFGNTHAGNTRSVFAVGRIMYEQRFLPRLVEQNNEVKREGTDFTTRLRILARGMMPLRPGAKFTKGQYVSLQNELFLHSSGKDHLYGKIFDQNRSAVATGYRFSQHFDAEISYMFRYAVSTDYVRDHTLQIVSFLRL